MKKLSEYTKAERHEIYKAAKKIFINWSEDRPFGGMCDAIADVIDKMGGFHPDEDVFEIGDELLEMKSIKPNRPLRQDKHILYWWHEENTKIRLKMFDKIIKMTEL